VKFCDTVTKSKIIRTPKDRATTTLRLMDAAQLIHSTNIPPQPPLASWTWKRSAQGTGSTKEPIKQRKRNRKRKRKSAKESTPYSFIPCCRPSCTSLCSVSFGRSDIPLKERLLMACTSLSLHILFLEKWRGLSTQSYSAVSTFPLDLVSSCVALLSHHVRSARSRLPLARSTWSTQQLAQLCVFPSMYKAVGLL